MKIQKSRQGFTLIEVALALAIAGSAMVWTYSLISNGLTMQRRGENLANAVLLARIKMAQIDASTKLEQKTDSGEIPGYRGYTYETIVREEELDLLKAAKGGSADDPAPPEDLLENSSNQGLDELLKKRGKTQNESQTGGIITVLRIIVKINYPDGYKTASYVAETFKAAKF